MPIVPFLLAKALTDPREAMRLIRIANEFEGYFVWRVYSALDEANVIQLLQQRPWWEFPDKELARMTEDIFVEKGYAVRKGDVVVFKNVRPPRPAVTSEAADAIPVIDRAASALARALATGEKPNLLEERAYYAKLLAIETYKLLVDITIEVTELSRLSEGQVILDVMPRVGTSLMSLLERTRARIIAVEPLASNISVITNTLKLTGQLDRVVILQSQPEAIKLPEKVDAAFMAGVLHWTNNPRFALARVRENLKESGFLSVYQPCYEAGGLILSLLHYLYGAVRPVPTKDEAQELVRQAGFKITKSVGSRGFLALRAEPS